MNSIDDILPIQQFDTSLSSLWLRLSLSPNEVLLQVRSLYHFTAVYVTDLEADSGWRTLKTRVTSYERIVIAPPKTLSDSLLAAGTRTYAFIVLTTNTSLPVARLSTPVLWQSVSFDSPLTAHVALCRVRISPP